MASFSSVPPELLRGIFGMLDHGSLKAVRLVSRYYSPIVEPLIFSEAVFDLDIGGIASLVRIAESPTLRQHVHTIRLHRRIVPRDFGAFEDWQGLTIHEYIGFEGLDDGDPDADRLDSELKDSTERPMSEQEWEALSDNDRRHLYEDYERERVTLQRHIGGLSALVLSQILGEESEHSFGTTNDDEDDHSLQLFLQSFEQAIKRLSQLSGFFHQPAHLDDCWGTRWRNIRFNMYGVLAMHDTEEDMYVDSLQQFLCFRTLALTKDAGRGRLLSTYLFTCGTAFWRPRDLMRMLNRFHRNESLSWRQEEEWIRNIQTREALNSEQTEHLTRQLVSIEHCIFAELNDLNWDIRYNNHDDSIDLGAVGRSLSYTLLSSRCLKKMCITFSQDTQLQSLSDTSYWPRDQGLTRTSSQQLPLQIAAYNRQQAASGAWLRPPGPRNYSFHYLQAVTLSVVTIERDLWAFLSELPALRHLALQHVALLPTGGSWESVLRKFHERLELQTIQLAMLEDAALTDDQMHMIPRAVLRPTEDIWKDCPEQAYCYQSHEDAVMDYVLGHSTLLPLLSPEALRHSHA
ncbi:hypothetical protein KCU99_g10043, partial [Aureobasidium melanogenum]